MNSFSAALKGLNRFTQLLTTAPARCLSRKGYPVMSGE
jgi:hypothetical protein